MTLSHIDTAVRSALQEDLPCGDITSSTLIPHTMMSTAKIIAQEPLTVAGICVAQAVFQAIDPRITMTPHFQDGQHVRTNQPVLTVHGPARSLLSAERVTLNFLQHLSGISTLTTHYCEAVRGFSVKILDTRKTTPGLRHLQKWAVRLGGGHNHRHSLSDGILIKDNHLFLLHAKKVGIAEACHRARAHGPHTLRISVEVESLTQVKQAITGQADIILLDNMNPPTVQKAVNLVNGCALIEVSGGVTLDNVREMASAGVDYISVGALTHSAPAVDIHMECGPLRSIGRPKQSKTLF